MGHFEEFEHKKSGISKKKHVTSLKTKNKSKMKVFDFGAFQINMLMASREKYIIHILFWAFHITPRIYFLCKGKSKNSGTHIKPVKVSINIKLLQYDWNMMEPQMKNSHSYIEMSLN